MLRVQCQCVAKRRVGIAQFALLLQRLAEVVVQLGLLRRQFAGAAQVDQRFVACTGIVQRTAEVGLYGGVGGALRRGLAQKFRGFDAVAAHQAGNPVQHLRIH